MIYLIGAVAILSAALIFSIKGNLKQSRAIKRYKQNAQIMADAEEKKRQIRQEAGDSEENILDNPNVDHGVLSVSAKAQHNHAFSDPCRKGCPAYSGE